MRVASIQGYITLPDGTRSSFYMGADYGWQQWDNERERLGQTVEVLEAIRDGLIEAEIEMGEDDD